MRCKLLFVTLAFVCHLVALLKLRTFLIFLETICEIAGSFHADSCLGLFIFNFTSA